MSHADSNRIDRGWQALGALAATLRSEQGCPWDRAQSVRTLLPYLVEEAHEALHAAELDDRQHLLEELGDACFVLSLTLQAIQDESLGEFEEIAARTVEKIQRRHPHVFGGESADTPDAVARRWEEIKRAERSEEDASEETSAPGSLSPPGPALPALWQAVKLQTKVAAVGFDWASPEPIVKKIQEELIEVEQALSDGSRADVREELGDLLFAVANLARRLAVDPESALRAANQKFRRRWNRMMALADARGEQPEQLGLERLDALWEAVKAEDREARRRADQKESGGA